MTMRHNKRATYGILGFTFGMIACIDAQSASVVSRTPRPTSGANAVLAAQSSAATTSATTSSATASTSQPASSAKSPTAGGNIPHSISNKSSYFSSFLGLSSSADATGTSLADKVRAQRELLAAKSATDEIVGKTVTVSAGANACDTALRACMTEKCGSDFSKCAGDSDTIWGQKIDSCRRNTTCTGHEYAQIAPEIRADRDFNERISAYTSVIDCGNRYNECIITECGANFGKCLGKTAGDHAISLCDKIARECASADNGLASRVMNVFGTLRGDAERAVQADERRLYELRDTMRGACERLGAMFDERSLDCVFTVNFYAGSDSTLYASKKAYAGASFTCDPNWFGIDVTTFMENAFRLTREQASASAAMLGSGLGIGVGAVTSGAIDRAIDRHKAERAVKKAEKEHEEMYGDGDDKKKDKKKDKDKDDSNEDDDDNKPGAAEKRCTKASGTWDNGTCTGAQCGDNKEWSDEKNKCVKIKEDKGNAKGTDKEGEKKSDGDKSVPERPDDKTAQKNCKKAKGDWADGICKNPKCGDDARWDDWTQTCKKYAAGEKPATYTDPETACRIQGGTWTGKTCLCKGFENKWNGVTYKCEPNSTSSGTSGLGGKGFGTSKLGTGNTFNKALSGTSSGTLAPTSGLKGNNAVTTNKTGTNSTSSTPPASPDKTKK